MLPNFSQYASQGLAPQIPGLQGIGAPQLNSVLGQPGLYGNRWSGHEPGQQVPPWPGQLNSFGHNPPTLQGQSGANSQIHNSVQTVAVLVQLAQQLAMQCAITQQFAQQLNLAVQQLANQLAVQGLQGQYFGQNPYAAAAQGAYPGFNPQVQAWGLNRPQSIQ